MLALNTCHIEILFFGMLFHNCLYITRYLTEFTYEKCFYVYHSFNLLYHVSLRSGANFETTRNDYVAYIQYKEFQMT